MPIPTTPAPTRATRRLLSAARHVRRLAGGRCERLSIAGKPCAAGSSGVGYRHDGTPYAACADHLPGRLDRFANDAARRFS